MSSTSAASQDARTSPACESTSSDEPTLTTMRRKFLSAGRFMDSVWQEGGSNRRHNVAWEVQALRGLCRSTLRHRRRPRLRLTLGLVGHRRLADHVDQRAQRVLHAFAGRA
ncbi:hypothetical protein ACVIHI_006808 [Bradyrhizobium sp. USDA 4524]